MYLVESLSLPVSGWISILLTEKTSVISNLAKFFDWNVFGFLFKIEIKWGGRVYLAKTRAMLPYEKWIPSPIPSPTFTLPFIGTALSRAADTLHV